MAETPTNLPLGFVTDAQFRTTREYFIPKTNAAGIPDTRAGCDTRVNGVFGGAVVEDFAQINNYFNGSVALPPGLANLQGKSWRSGDDGANVVESNDMIAYGITPPSDLWQLNGALSAYLGTVPLIASDAVPDAMWELVNARGGINGEANFIYAGKSTYSMYRRTQAALPGMGATVAFAGFFSFSEWNQTQAGIVLATYRLYNSAVESGVASNLGFEIGLGYPSAIAVPGELALYYRHYNAAGSEVVRYPTTSSSGHITFRYGSEFFLAFTRSGTTLNIFVNGILLSTFSLGAGNGGSPGTSPDMRLILGANWDGTKYLNGGIRGACVWTGAQPTAAELLSYYRVGAGFLPKAPPGA